MNTQLNRITAAGLLAAGLALASTPSVAGVRVCTFPGSPSTKLDRTVAQEVFKTAGVAASFAAHGIDDGDDDGISVRELDKAVGRRCDVIAGFPRSSVADASGGKMRFSRGYLQTGYVSVEARDAQTSDAVKDVVAATYASPAQLIAVQQQGVRLDLQNTSEQTVEAVATGHARRAIVWYPSLVAYGVAHPLQHFDVTATTSPYADWHLAFAFDGKNAALQTRIDAALARMEADGRLAALTRAWAMPGGAKRAQSNVTPLAYRDGPAPGGARIRGAGLASAGTGGMGGIIRVASDAATEAPSFDLKQAKHGKSLYSGACAKCHGAQLQGNTAPALSGPAFAPASHAHLTIGGVFAYMANNMPADHPGKMKDQDYADLMAFLLYSNGYRPGGAKLTADGARASATPLNAGPQQ